MCVRVREGVSPHIQSECPFLPKYDRDWPPKWCIFFEEYSHFHKGAPKPSPHPFKRRGLRRDSSGPKYWARQIGVFFEECALFCKSWCPSFGRFGRFFIFFEKYAHLVRPPPNDRESGSMRPHWSQIEQKKTPRFAKWCIFFEEYSNLAWTLFRRAAPKTLANQGHKLNTKKDTKICKMVHILRRILQFSVDIISARCPQIGQQWSHIEQKKTPRFAKWCIFFEE